MFEFVDPVLTIVSVLLICTCAATAYYARHRMDVLHKVTQNQVDRLEHEATELENKLNATHASISQDLNSQKENLANLTQAATEQQTYLEKLSTHNKGFEHEFIEVKNKISDIETIIAATKVKLSLINDELSINRVADVEQLAIAAAVIAGESHNSDRTHPSELAPALHGHVLLICQLFIDSCKAPATTKSKYHLLEIGTTRDRFWQQMSTSRLALACRALGYNMVTVDVDAESSAMAYPIKDTYPDTLDVVTMAGEDYVEDWQGELPPYIYIDAYDFDHDHHSNERQARYIELQGAKINDEDCWNMHLRCAEAFVSKCPKNGVVVFDDAFLEDGKWEGKGKLAVPFMLQNGFKIEATTPRTLALRKN